MVLVNDPVEWAARRDATAPALASAGYFSFYSSCADAITTNPLLMTVPIDDHAIVRGHAVFDTCSLANGRLYRLQIHLDRLFSSAAAARLQLPFGDGSEAVNRKKITEIVGETCKASGKRDCDVRFWLTAGTGNLGVTPTGCTPGFYVLCFGGLPMPASWGTDGVPEATVCCDVVPFKPKLLAELKSNNYMLNALLMMAAKDRGGTFGLGVDANGFLTESCVLNVLVLGKDGVLRTPPFDGILKGTTVRKALELAKEHLVGSGSDSTEEKSIGVGLIEGVSQEPIPVAEARQAREIIFVAGDSHIYSAVSLDGAAIGDGKPGPVFSALRDHLIKFAREGTGRDHEDVPGLSC